MGLASFNRMRLRRQEAMIPENIIKEKEKVIQKEDPNKQAYIQKVIDEAKAKAAQPEKSNDETKEKEPAKRGSNRKK